MLTYPWKCTVLHCNHLGNTWKPLVLMTQQFDHCQSASEGDNQSARSSAPVVSRGFPGGYDVKLYISRGRLAWWLLAFLCCVCCRIIHMLCCMKKWKLLVTALHSTSISWYYISPHSDTLYFVCHGTPQGCVVFIHHTSHWHYLLKC